MPRRGNTEGLKWLVGVNMNTCGLKADDVCMGSMVSVQLVSLVVKFLGLSSEQDAEP